MGNPLLRQWMILNLVPKWPRKVSTRELRDDLAERGIQVSIRTIQRDLLKISEIFPLENDGSKDIPGWFWSRDADIFDIPSMEPSVALAFKLVQEHLTDLLPFSVLGQLKPYFERASQVLNNLQGSGLSSWHEMVKVVPETQRLLPSEIKDEVLNAVYDALLRQKRLKARYTPRGKETREYEISPLGLIFRQRIAYLLGTTWDGDIVRQFALHRFGSAEITDVNVLRPADFDLDKYISSGFIDYLIGKEKRIHLVALFTRDAGYHLYETPLSEDQEIIPTRDGDLKISATVFDTSQLRWWLLGFGDQVEVLKPRKLREEFSNVARSMAAKYKKRGATTR